MLLLNWIPLTEKKTLMVCGFVVIDLYYFCVAINWIPLTGQKTLMVCDFVLTDLSVML